MIQCNVLGRSESRTQQKLEKAKELVKKLKVSSLAQPSI
jgi:TRAF-interacting protein